MFITVAKHLQKYIKKHTNNKVAHNTPLVFTFRDRTKNILYSQQH